MSVKRMTAKFPGVCRNCSGAIRPGQTILWAKSTGAYHTNCNTARMNSTICPACNGKGMSGWQGNTPCGRCDSTGTVNPDSVSAVDPTDLAYEDSCARACGL